MESCSLSEILSELKDEIYGTFSDSFWLHAEVSECRENQSGHCYLELIEKDEHEKIVAKIKATVWAAVYRVMKPYFENVTGMPLQTGMKILMQANFEFHEVYGLSLSITDIEPAYTVGDIALHRDEIIRRLTEEGVVDMNKELALPIVLQRIAVISSPTAAGYGDFMNQLQNNRYGYKFKCTLFTAKMQGEQTGQSVIGALNEISEHLDDFDAVAIIRGGGAISELSAFDSYDLAYYCTQFPLPILSGIGHQRDLSVVDLVANQSMKTPTAVADFLVECVMNYEETLRDLLGRASQAMKRSLEQQERSLMQLSMRLVQAPQKMLTSRIRLLDNLWIRLQNGLQRKVNAHGQHLMTLQHRLMFCLPEECMAHGYVRISNAERWIKSSRNLKSGDAIKIQFIDGEKEATVK